MNRRNFLTATSAAALTPTLFGQEKDKPLFEISLAQWSNHRMLKAGKLTNLDWPKYTQETYGIQALEYVNQFFKDKAEDAAYLADLNKRVNDLGMTNVLIMIDGEGSIGSPSEKRARQNGRLNIRSGSPPPKPSAATLSESTPMAKAPPKKQPNKSPTGFTSSPPLPPSMTSTSSSKTTAETPPTESGWLESSPPSTCPIAVPCPTLVTSTNTIATKA